MTTDSKIIVPDTPAHFEGLSKSLTEMGISHTPVTVHTSEGTQRAVRISMAACYVLATLNLIQPN